MTFDEPRGVNLGDGWSIADEEFARSQADEAWYRAQTSSNGSEPETLTGSIVWAEEFVSTAEAVVPALLGTQAETILPVDGILLMYGDGGAGKTTLTLDAVVHMAGRRNWLGLEVADPVRSLIVENEGPRGKFRQILGEKLEGTGLGRSVAVLDEPWSRFTVADPVLRSMVADFVNAEEIGLIVLGPLATVGMVGGGTPDEISAFERLLGELRSLIEHPVAFWIVHHENKSGDVSGAWERVPDTLVHVQAAGNGHTRFVFRKSRWSSERHGTTLNLAWSDGRTFSVVEDVARDYYAEVLDAFREADEWRTSKEVSTLVKCRPGEAKSVLAELTRRGDLMFEIGPLGRHRNAHCWRLASATILSLVPDPPSGDDGFAF